MFDDRLSDEIMNHIFHVQPMYRLIKGQCARERASNTGRHTHSTLALSERKLMLLVSDVGVGFILCISHLPCARSCIIHHQVMYAK